MNFKKTFDLDNAMSAWPLNTATKPLTPEEIKSRNVPKTLACSSFTPKGGPLLIGFDIGVDDRTTFLAAPPSVSLNANFGESKNQDYKELAFRF